MENEILEKILDELRDARLQMISDRKGTVDEDEINDLKKENEKLKIGNKELEKRLDKLEERLKEKNNKVEELFNKNNNLIREQIRNQQNMIDKKIEGIYNHMEMRMEMRKATTDFAYRIY